ncbi:hypothetical protein HDU91_001490 [Kappamyces sp. JEL0680]|nr:hypothetical protein HDU91_001490 [Kappamyces sp. JEL0680]
MGMQIDVFDKFTKMIEPNDDAKVAQDYFVLHWPEREPIYFHPFKTKSPAKGASVEGIYRISGSKTEFNDLRVLVESNVHAVNYISNDIDVHLLAGLVKSYLRELPAPLLVFSSKERMEYSSNPNEEERVLALTSRIRTLPKEKMTLLKALCEHLSK